MSDIPTATPLVEQLKDVPIDGSDCYPISSVHHKNIPYGELCRAAAKEIEQLKRELCEAREALADIALMDTSGLAAPAVCRALRSLGQWKDILDAKTTQDLRQSMEDAK